MMKSVAPKLGILLPTRGVILKDGAHPDLSPLFAMAEQAEQAGLDSIWVGDSLLSKPRLEPLATLAALAMKTSRVRLGTAVMLGPLRQPVQLAQMAATVDVLSGGRLVLGMGVGGVFTDEQKQEWLAVGVPPQERGRRMTELAQVCHRLWTEDAVTFTGRYFQVEKAAMLPRPVQPGGVPMLLACHKTTGSPGQYRRAALYADGVMGISDTPSQYGETLGMVRGYAAEAGRDPDAFQTAFYMTVNVNHDKDAAFREADDFIRRYYGLNFWAERWGPFGPAEAVAERIMDYHAAGAQEVIVRFASLDPLSQLYAFLEDVLPLVRKATKRRAGTQ
ncbi:MAG: LLM class flavin-dependent oxidoreductase [Dehalococcoidia bacterium]|nr:LLM class flavin-dependent oxidoreductase [Dehalococcoidia bacterium]